ncbi:hypothetical protein C1H46_021511 [Malus baccata]|uniref:Uncharacterized protein n=1 Tax=Malus baccata TaxID=106549 RepID=A0A540M2F3_MALBA|nr:hypothetical protein C1H46_021511 [Malus baccata]
MAGHPSRASDWARPWGRRPTCCSLEKASGGLCVSDEFLCGRRIEDGCDFEEEGGGGFGERNE